MLQKSCLIFGLTATCGALWINLTDPSYNLPQGHFHHQGQEAPLWDYGPTQGPSSWGNKFSNFCSGESQSPIDIVTSDVVVEDPGPITLVGWDRELEGSLTNNGHSLSFAFSEESQGDKPHITGGRLGAERFDFLSLHWHWGKDSSRGSEHTRDGMPFPLEMHMVHTNVKYGDNFAKYQDGLAVLGFFFEVSEENNTDLSALLDTAEKMKMTESHLWKAKVPSLVRLDQMVDPRGVGDNYFFYSGSLTTPGCHEVVLWTHYETTLSISESQLTVFRGLKNSQGRDLRDNFRPVMPLNSRRVYKRSVKRLELGVSNPADLAVESWHQSDLATGVLGQLVMGVVGALLISVLASLLLPEIVPKSRRSHDHHLQLLLGGHKRFGGAP